MSKKLVFISIVTALAVGAVTCGASDAFAEESTSPPQEVSSPTPPPPSQGGEFHPPAGETRSPEMMGRPMESGTGRQEEAKRYNEEYQKQYQKQYGEEVGRQTEAKTREMQMRYAPSGGDRDIQRTMRSQMGQPFSEGGRDNAQGKPFMGDRMPQGRPFGGGPEGNYGPNGGPQGGFGEHEMMREGGDFGGFGGSGGEGENMGPSEEEMEKMMQEQESRMKEEQLRQMKRGMQGLEQGLKQIQRMVDRLAKKGIAIPLDIQTLLSELTAVRDKVKSATEFNEEVEAAMDVIQERGQDLGEAGQKLGMLEQMAQMTTQVEKQFVTLDKALAKAKKRKEASQFPSVVAKVDAQIGALKQRWSEVKQGALSGDADPEDLRETMDGIFEEVGEAHRAIEMIRQLGSVAKMVKSAEKEIATFEKTIARQKKAGKDVSRLEELLAQGKAKLAEIKTLTAQSGFEPEDLFDLMQEIEHIGNAAHDELDRITGKADTKQLQGAVVESLRMRRLGL